MTSHYQSYLAKIPELAERTAWILEVLDVGGEMRPLHPSAAEGIESQAISAGIVERQSMLVGKGRFARKTARGMNVALQMGATNSTDGAANRRSLGTGPG